MGSDPNANMMAHVAEFPVPNITRPSQYPLPAPTAMFPAKSTEIIVYLFTVTEVESG